MPCCRTTDNSRQKQKGYGHIFLKLLEYSRSFYSPSLAGRERSQKGSRNDTILSLNFYAHTHKPKHIFYEGEQRIAFLHSYNGKAFVDEQK